MQNRERKNSLAVHSIRINDNQQNKKITLEELNSDFNSKESEGLDDPITSQLTILPVKPDFKSKLQPIEKGALLQIIESRRNAGLPSFHPLSPDLALNHVILNRYIVDYNYIQKRNNYLQKFKFTEDDFLKYRNVSRQEYKALLSSGSFAYKMMCYLNLFIEKFGPGILFILTDTCLVLLLDYAKSSYIFEPKCIKTFKNTLFHPRKTSTYQLGNHTVSITTPRLNFCSEDFGRLKKIFVDIEKRKNPFFAADKIDLNYLLGFPNGTFSELIREQYSFNKADLLFVDKMAFKTLNWLRYPLALWMYFRDPNSFSTVGFYLGVNFGFKWSAYIIQDVLDRFAAANYVCNQFDISFNNRTVMYEPTECNELSQTVDTGLDTTLSIIACNLVLRYLIFPMCTRSINAVTNFFAPKRVPHDYYNRQPLEDDKEHKEVKRCGHSLRQRCVIQ